ncbi:ComEC/Rec2 family competence protein [Pseudomonas syringae]|jgi:beta-lactamase superfamily II metal-dependent hydrolase|uniref:ComEC/Rec2 family competence protein n=1 Tax=Pseudomonas syringae TaxID=317 RepID=UPI0006CB56C8|nr:hypothetical protein [Pseudomonas syringae]ALE00500.1 hypothetical protein PSYRMG_12465 [Pseudomonas syringae UMAF0158]MCH5651678.1 hypothetical protein [Pseudomonas syringae]MCK9730849.1 hypothetical protein [Pseudomonas syringae pv. syringae]
MLTLQLLPAREGDALWVRWGSPDTPYQMLIDMGPQETGTELRERISALPEDQRSFELIVVTHIDRDHIGGLLSCLVDVEPLPGLTAKDIWFNGFAHLDGSKHQGKFESMGPAQGERLSHWLGKQNWNKSFAGGPVCCETGMPLPHRDLEGGMRLTVLGPTAKRLSELKSVWRKEIETALKKAQQSAAGKGLERMGASYPRILENKKALDQLAEQQLTTDNSPANASSITLLLEYQDIRILLAGDALPKDLKDSVQLISTKKPLELTAFKVPHHGSRKNISKALIESVHCRYWLISTDGSRFQHPDDEAVARIISHSKHSNTTLGFNVRSEFNAKWDSDDWRKKFDYYTTYGNAEDGLTMKFQAAP